MRSATQIATQLHEYVTTGQLKVADKEIDLSTERLAAWRMVLDRTIPSLSSTEITHKTGVEAIGTDKLVARLADLSKARPELAVQLQEALGIRVLEHNPDTIPEDSSQDALIPADPS
jgi:hypothetical protein